LGYLPEAPTISKEIWKRAAELACDRHFRYGIFSNEDFPELAEGTYIVPSAETRCKHSEAQVHATISEVLKADASKYNHLCSLDSVQGILDEYESFEGLMECAFSFYTVTKLVDPIGDYICYSCTCPQFLDFCNCKHVLSLAAIHKVPLHRL